MQLKRGALGGSGIKIAISIVLMEAGKLNYVTFANMENEKNYN